MVITLIHPPLITSAGSSVKRKKPSGEKGQKQPKKVTFWVAQNWTSVTGVGQTT